LRQSLILLPGKLNTRSILSAPYEWFDLVEECKEVGVELLDLTVSVPHRQLIAKLQTSGLHIYALKSYTGRMQIVVLKCGIFAAISSIVRSPPRICPGAPFFPCVATCDAGISNGSKMRVFADDILQNQSVHSQDDHTELQHGVNSLFV